jgi:hypothetical protein
MYSYSLGLELSFDTHIDDLLRFFQKVNKLRCLFTSIKHKQTINFKKLAFQNCESGMGEDIHQVSKDLKTQRMRNPIKCVLSVYVSKM